jgi:hemolysin III
LKKNEKVNFLTHLFGAVAMAAATVLLTYSARTNLVAFAVALIYGCSSTILFTASTLYHFKKKEENEKSIWRTIDHMSIYIMIAGTYTPICILVFSSTWGITIVSIQWGLAIAGFLSEMFWKKRPRWISTLIYLSMGWVVVTAIMPLIHGLTPNLLTLLVLAGISYSSGAIIYALKKPNPLPGLFGFHEIFHTLVLLANGFLFVMIYNIIKTQ